jgi:hypothetical protein
MKPSVIVEFGPQNTLKTSIMLSILETKGFEDKILKVYDFDLGFDRAWNSDQLIADGRVVVETMFLPTRNLQRKDSTMVGFSEIWKDFTEGVMADFKDPKVGGVGWDTGTAVWALCRDAFLQEIQRGNASRKQLQQIEYGEPNSRMNELFAASKANKTFLFSLHHETDEYVTLTMGGRPVLDEQGNAKTATSGVKLPDGFKATRDKADWVLYTSDRDGTPVVEIKKTAEGWQLKGSAWEWFDFTQLETAIAMYKGVSAVPTPQTAEMEATV